LYIDIDSVENGSGVINTVKELIGKDAPSRARRVVRTDDVIMSEVRPYLKAFALVPKRLNNQICSTGFAVLRSKGTIDPKYLLNVLFSNDVIDQCNRMMVGAQYPALNDSQVKKIQIPLPPLPEQRRIAAILTTVDAAIQRSRLAAAETERLKAGVMQELMTKGIGHTEFKKDSDVGMVPKDWKIVTLEEISEIRGRIGWRGYTTKDLRDSGPLTLGAEHITPDNKLNLISRTHISLEKYNESPEIQVHKNDLLIVQRGSTIGKVVLVDKDIGDATINSSMILVTKIKINQIFLFYWLCSHYIQNKINESISQTGQPMIRQAQVKTFLIPILSLPEQQQIATILTTIDRKLDLQRQRTAHYEHLKQGLMNELLTGRRQVKVT